MANQITLDQAVEQIGFGKFQSKLMTICGMGWAADAMEVLLISFAIPAIGEEWNLSAGQKALLATAIFLGMLMGAYIWGRIADTRGRKIGFISTIAIDSIFGLASAFSPSFAWLVVLRGLTGFGVGGTLPVDYAIFAEYLPANKRGRYLVLLESFWALGYLLAAGLAWLIVPRLGWRWLLAISALPGLIIFIIRRSIPESPRYLLVQGRSEEAAAVLRRVAQYNGVSMGDFSLAPLEKTAPARVQDLLHPSLRRSTFLLWLIWFAISLGYYGVFTWLPNYFRGLGMTLLPVYQNAFILALAQIPGYFSAAWLVEKWGRRRTMAVFLFASALFTYLFAAATGLNWVLAMGIWMSFFTLGAWGVIYAVTPEVYPTSLRGTGMGTASGFTRIAGALAPSLGALLMGSGLGLSLTVFAISYAVAGLAALFLPYETSQKPLEDVLHS